MKYTIYKDRRGSIDELTCAEKANIIFYMNTNPEVQPKSITKKFAVKQVVIDELKNKEIADVLDKETHWNPAWNNSDVIFHPDVDCNDELDIAIGDDDFVNKGTHIVWTNDDCILLLIKSLERSLDIVRDTPAGSTQFCDALDFIESDVSKLLCKALGYDHAELIKQTYIAKGNFDNASLRDFNSIFEF